MIRDSFINKLLRWGNNNIRSFPWRKTKNPFHILIAEILLQKTEANQVKAIYSYIANKYNTPSKLAKANISMLKNELHNLGIHCRAKRMKNMARMLVEHFDETVPNNKRDLLSLPGVGQYIANAMLCFAFNQDVPLLDANIIRVLGRIFGMKSKLKRARNDKRCWEFASKYIPAHGAITYNRSILDFASLVCKAKKPKCGICPFKANCLYLSSN